MIIKLGTCIAILYVIYIGASSIWTAQIRLAEGRGEDRQKIRCYEAHSKIIREYYDKKGQKR